MTVLEKLVNGFCERVPLPPGAEILLEEYLMAFAEHVSEDPKNLKEERDGYNERKIPKNVIVHNFLDDSHP